MDKLKEEIRDTIAQMQGDICEGSHCELQDHLRILLDMLRHELDVHVSEQSWGTPNAD